MYAVYIADAIYACHGRNTAEMKAGRLTDDTLRILDVAIRTYLGACD